MKRTKTTRTWAAGAVRDPTPAVFPVTGSPMSAAIGRLTSQPGIAPSTANPAMRQEDTAATHGRQPTGHTTTARGTSWQPPIGSTLTPNPRPKGAMARPTSTGPAITTDTPRTHMMEKAEPLRGTPRRRTHASMPMAASGIIRSGRMSRNAGKPDLSPRRARATTRTYPATRQTTGITDDTHPIAARKRPEAKPVIGEPPPRQQAQPMASPMATG